MDITSYLLGKQAGGGGSEVNLQNNKQVTITSNTMTEVTPDTGYDAVKKVQVTTNVQPNLESKSVTITENGTTTVTPTTGKDGLSSVSVITNVSGGGGLDWSAIGYSEEPQSITDDYNYAKDIYDNWVPATSLQFKFISDYFLGIMPLVDTSITTNMYGMFNNCRALKNVPLLNTSNVTSIYGMFDYCVALVSIPQFDTSNVQDMQAVFRYCYSLKDVPQFDTSKVKYMNNMFQDCSNLTDTSLDNILKMCIGTTSEYIRTKTLAQLGFSSTYYPVSRIEALPHYQDFLDAGWTIGY